MQENSNPTPAVGQENSPGLHQLPNGDLRYVAIPRQMPIAMSTDLRIAEYNARCAMMFADLILSPRNPIRLPGYSADDAYDMAREHQFFGEGE